MYEENDVGRAAQEVAENVASILQVYLSPSFCILFPENFREGANLYDLHILCMALFSRSVADLGKL